MIRLISIVLALLPAGIYGVSPDEVVREATLQAVDARMPGAAAHLEIQVVRLVDTPDPLPSIDVVLPTSPLIPRGRIQVRLQTRGTNQDAGWAMLEVARFDSVAVALNRIDRGTTVTREDLAFVWIETTRFSGTPLTPATLGQIGTELVAARTLRAERSLRAGDLAAPPAAEAGSTVRMVFSRSTFRLELACTSRERGSIGDIIRLYASDSDTMYRARLVAPGLAEWIETL